MSFLLSSSEELPKVVFRTDTSSTYAVLKRLAEAGGPPPRHLFDLSAAYRLLDYVHHGQSVFKSQAPSLQTMWEGLRLGGGGTAAASRMERYYRCYLALRHLLPPAALQFLAAKTAIDASIGAGAADLNREKQKRKDLRAAWDVNAVHVRPLRGITAEKREQFNAKMADCMNMHSIRQWRLIDLGKHLPKKAIFYIHILL
jgi:hypothetical protein